MSDRIREFLEEPHYVFASYKGPRMLYSKKLFIGSYVTKIAAGIL